MQYVQTDDGIVKAMIFLFVVKLLTTAVCVSCRKMRQKVLDNGNSVIKACTSILHFDNATKIRILHIFIWFVFTSSMTLARLR